MKIFAERLPSVAKANARTKGDLERPSVAEATLESQLLYGITPLGGRINRQ